MSVGNDWLVYDDSGTFDASKNGGSLVAAVEGGRAYRIDQLAARNNRPDLLMQKLGLADATAIEHFRALHERRLQRSKLDKTQLASAFRDVPRVNIVDSKVTDKRITLTFDLTTTDELRSYNVWANGVPLYGEGKVVYVRTRSGGELVSSMLLKMPR